jgi:hypothetical protein
MAQKKGIHYAIYETSDRLQQFLAYMLDGAQRTTREILDAVDICAVNSAACELRKNGFRLLCVKKSRPAIYQLVDVEAARSLSQRLLAPKAAVNG